MPLDLPREVLPRHWPEPLPGQAVIVASAPGAREPAGPAVLPITHYAADQVLLGFEAQLRAFGHMMRRHGRSVAFTPLPEIFAGPRSLAAIAAERGIHDAHTEILHLRFGPARSARVLKGSRNMMVLADDPIRLPLDTTIHPLGSGICLPAPFGTLFTYAPRRVHPAVAGGKALHEHLLPDPFVWADIEGEAADEVGEAPEPAQRWSCIAGLHVRSLAEYQAGEWLAPGATAGGAGSVAWRRALALAKGGERTAEEAGFIMVPWNLANPASIVPDLMGKLSRSAPLEEAGRWIVLFPFNATPTSAVLVDEVVAGIRRLAGGRSAVLRSFFLARLDALRDANQLRHLFPLAWLEADDPESDWTRRRLARLGIPVGLMGADGGGETCRFAVAADETIRLRVCDSFGEHAFPTRSLSQRGLSALLTRSGEVLARRERVLQPEIAIER